jgi:hypothetical protein
MQTWSEGVHASSFDVFAEHDGECVALHSRRGAEAYFHLPNRVAHTKAPALGDTVVRSQLPAAQPGEIRGRAVGDASVLRPPLQRIARALEGCL